MNCESIVIKVASRCNLNCTYCYMYNLGDLTYKNQPKFMPKAVVDSILFQVKKHIITHQLKRFTIIFHGGEPLLAPRYFYEDFVNKANSILSDLKNFELYFSLQTNGVLIDKEWCKLFEKLNIRVGISIDGTKKSHDMYRIDHSGKGSYNDVVRGIKEYKEAFFNVGVISVLNIEEDPIEIYENFKEIGVGNFDILFPDCHYDSIKKQENNTPIADWLIKLFDIWSKDLSVVKIEINIFNTLINLILGLPNSGNEIYGESNNNVVVIETNGAIEAVDTLKSCGNGFTKNNMNILKNTLDEAMDNPLIKLYYKSHSYVSKKCKSCPLLTICGGGYIAHRYSKKNGFNNPSVYCNDLIKLIVYIQNKLFLEFSESTLKKLDVEILTIDFVNNSITEGLKFFDNRDSKNQYEFLESFKQHNISCF